MKFSVPANFTLLFLAMACIVLGGYIPTPSPGATMLTQFWPILLVLIQPKEPVLPQFEVKDKPNAQLPDQDGPGDGASKPPVA